ncbi:MAG: LysE family translocator [Kiloniellaceae bacterium]|nr:LysE family translocator [Kiloniellaceae bacterium]
MFDPTLLGAFLLISAALVLSPGPDTLFVIASGLRHRAAGAVVAALGIGTGSALHGLAAALGVSALLAAAPWFFEALRFAGAAYLAYLGIKALRAALAPAPAGAAARPAAAASLARVYRQAVVTNLLNPKIVVFYLALLPQFVAPELGHIGLQMFLLSCIPNGLGTAYLMLVGLGSGAAAGWLSRRAFARWLDGIAGAFFIGLALRLALGGRVER